MNMRKFMTQYRNVLLLGALMLTLGGILVQIVG